MRLNEPPDIIGAIVDEIVHGMTPLGDDPADPRRWWRVCVDGVKYIITRGSDDGGSTSYFGWDFPGRDFAPSEPRGAEFYGRTLEELLRDLAHHIDGQRGMKRRASGGR
jgi:hypothetical protein